MAPAADQSEKGAPSKTARPLRPQAQPARFRRRHIVLVLSFLIGVVTPLMVSGVYLYGVADDQYASHVGFSVRKEDVSSAVELLGGITELSGSSSSDTDILYEFIQSQQMVRLVDRRLSLKRIYSNPSDPVFSLGDDSRIEALSGYWRRMVKVFYDSASGLIEVRVLAFNPQDAQDIALALFEESSRMINELSAIARADAMRYAEEELERAVARLKETRQAKTAFQNRTQIVDPSVDVQGQMGLLNSLQSQLATASIELKLLLDTSAESDPRVQQARRKIEAVNALIDQERKKFSSSGNALGSNDAYSDLLSEFQALQVDLEFAQESYLSAQAARDSSLAEAQRKSRYLALHIEPTLAETPEYPRRVVLLGLIAALAFISWAIMAMIYYSLRDRR